MDDRLLIGLGFSILGIILILYEFNQIAKDYYAKDKLNEGVKE